MPRILIFVACLVLSAACSGDSGAPDPGEPRDASSPRDPDTTPPGDPQPTEDAATTPPPTFDLCPASVETGQSCAGALADALCSSSSMCCRCNRYQATSCGQDWFCADPSGNDPGCPPAPPTLEARCESPGSSTGRARIRCSYCLDSGPEFYACSGPLLPEDAELKWISAAPISCDE